MGPPNLFIDTFPPRTSVIAFIDILGFRELVERTYGDATDTEKLQASQTLSDALESISASNEQDDLERGWLRVTSVSGTVVISDDVRHGVERVLGAVSRLAAALLWRGFACRGGISSGLLVHQEGIVLGPAMIAAYALARAAVYPRIVIDHSLELNRDERSLHWSVVRDQDGLQFLDAFHRIRHVHRPDTTPETRLDRVCGLIVERLKQARDAGRPDVVAKWRWLAAQLNLDA
jgi:hypothetical protein